MRAAQLVIYVSSPQQNTCAQLASSRTSPIGHRISSMGGLSTVGGKLVYDGPLPRHCSCQPQHSPMVGARGQEDFRSSSQVFPWPKFLVSYFSRFRQPYEPSSVTDGVTSVVPSSFSLLQRPGSWANLYSGWAAGKLTRSMLRDYNCLLYTSPSPRD